MGAIQHRVMIVGPPRSGTTLLQQILSAHPDIYTLPETHYFQFMLRTDLRRLVDRFYVSRRRFRAFEDFAVSSNRLHVDVDGYIYWNARRVVDYFARLMDSGANAAGKHCWVEKTPGHLNYIDVIERYRHGIRIIHVLRRPEDVAASLVKVGRDHPDKWPYFDSLEYCIREVELSYAAIARYHGRKNHVLVHFERLLSMPDKTIGSLLNAIGLDANDATVSGIVSGLNAGSVSRSDEAWKTGYGKSIRRNRTSGFVELFDANEQAQIRRELAGAIGIYERLTEAGLD